MKKFLILMRHGEARETQVGGSDYDRSLTPKGEEAVRAQALAMAEKNIWPDKVLCSSALRTRQTGDILRMAWEGDMEPIVEHRTDLYQSAPADILKMIRAQDTSLETMMIIGHNPTIHQLAMSLCAPGEYSKCPKLGKGYPPAAIAQFEFNMRGWSEIGEGKGVLLGFITSKA